MMNDDSLRPGQTIAAVQRNLSQHCWPSVCKPWPSDRNISTQHIATLLGQHVARVWPPSCAGSVAACCELKIDLVRMPWRNIVARTWPNDHNNKQHPQMLREIFEYFQI